MEQLRGLSQSLSTLRQREERYASHLEARKQANQSDIVLEKVQYDLRETQEELTLVEAEARQTQQQAEALERQERQLNVRRQLEEWQRLK